MHNYVYDCNVHCFYTTLHLHAHIYIIYYIYIRYCYYNPRCVLLSKIIIIIISINMSGILGFSINSTTLYFPHTACMSPHQTDNENILWLCDQDAKCLIAIIIIVKMYFRILKYFNHALTKLDLHYSIYHYSDKFIVHTRRQLIKQIINNK